MPVRKSVGEEGDQISSKRDQCATGGGDYQVQPLYSTTNAKYYHDAEAIFAHGVDLETSLFRREGFLFLFSKGVPLGEHDYKGSEKRVPEPHFCVFDASSTKETKILSHEPLHLCGDGSRVSEPFSCEWFFRSVGIFYLHNPSFRSAH